ncbi:MAG: AEC family transporter [Lentisphaeria bacterium]|nr:AEC family transporter [Lentisphaeria bacterium]
MLTIFSVSFFSVLKIVLVCLAGTWLARRGILDAAFRRTMSHLILALMLPCLLVSRLSVGASSGNLLRWLAMPLSALVYVALGFGVGWLVLFLVRPPEPLRRLVTASTAFGNSGYVPYPLVGAIAATAPVFAADPTAADRGMAYVSLYLVCMSPCLWGIGFPYLAHRPLRELRPGHVLSPPILSALAGIVIGVVPFLNRLLVSPDAPLRILLDTAALIGDGVIPCSLLVLGANLAERVPANVGIPTRVYAGVIWGRLILMPVIGCLYTLTLLRFGLLPEDPMFLLVLLLESAVPSATNLIVMCQVHSRGEAAMSRLLVVTYVAAVVTLTASVSLFLWVLERL